MVMSDKDLERTKPIKILKDLSEQKDETSTREAKYKDALEIDEKKIKEEEAEEALAEKNILMAEEILEKEKTKKEEMEKLEEDIDKEIEGKTKKKKEKKDSFITTLKDKWKSLTKKQKILIFVLGGILLVLLVVLIVLLVVKLNGNEEEKPLVDAPKEEVVPVIVDNFYYKEGNLHFLNSEETEVGSYECSNKDDSLCYVAMNVNRDNFDVTMLVDEEGNLREQRLPVLHDNYVFVVDKKSEKENEIVLYSIKDEKELGRYLEVKLFESGDIIVKSTDEQYGLINIDATNGVVEKIKNKYKYLGMIEGAKSLIAQTKDGYFVVNNKGKELSEPITADADIKYYNDNMIVILTGKEYSVYDYKGNLIDGGYDFATVYEKYALLVKNNRVYVRDLEKNKYTESGIKLNTTDYVKTYVYDKDDKLIETKRCFEVKVNEESELEFTLWKNGTDEVFFERLSLAEPNVNKNYAYVNYFDGKLYFYSDEEKEELLGFYSCTNSNVVDMKSTKYASCFIANDTLFSDNDMMPDGYLYRNSAIPIINDRYAFISDGNNNIVLFDIVEKESKSSYNKVETNTLHNDYKITKFTGNMNVIVQNKKKKYGLITVSKDGINVKHKFEYNKLEFIGDYVLGLDSSNNWRLLFDNVESMGFANKIRGYNSNRKYFKVTENDKYYVYSESSTKVSKDSYAYVELYTDYYAAMDSNRNLSVYDYTGKKLSEDTVKIGNYALYSTTNPAFKVKKSGDNYIVSVWDGTKYNDSTLSKKVEKLPEVTEEEKEDDKEENGTDKKEENKEEVKEEESKEETSEETIQQS